MAVLTIGTADIKRLCAIGGGDLSHDADIAALVSVEQPAWEYGLDPSVVTAAGGGDAGPAGAGQSGAGGDADAGGGGTDGGQLSGAGGAVAGLHR